MIQTNNTYAEYYYTEPTDRPTLNPDFKGVYVPAMETYYNHVFGRCEKVSSKPAFDGNDVKVISLEMPSEVYALFEKYVLASQQVDNFTKEVQTERQGIDAELCQNAASDDKTLECVIYQRALKNQKWFEVSIPSEKLLFESHFFMPRLRAKEALNSEHYKHLPQAAIKINQIMLERIKQLCSKASQYEPMYQACRALRTEFVENSKLLIQVKATEKLI